MPNMRVSLITSDQFNVTSLRKAVSLGNGIYKIEKIEFQNTPEDLLEIYRLLQNGEIWLVKGKTQFAVKNHDKLNVKQIVKQKIVNGKINLQDISKKKTLSELTTEDLMNIKKWVDKTITLLEKNKETVSTHSILINESTKLRTGKIKQGEVVQTEDLIRNVDGLRKKTRQKYERNNRQHQRQAEEAHLQAERKLKRKDEQQIRKDKAIKGKRKQWDENQENLQAEIQ